MRILLIGSHLGFNLEQFVKHGLESLGHTVDFVGYQDEHRMNNFIRMALTRSFILRKWFSSAWHNAFLRRIQTYCEKLPPDILLSIKGEMLDAKSIEFLGKEFQIRTALWYPDDPRFFDSLVRHIAPSYDYVFTKSEKMIPRYKEIGADHVHQLAFACDPQIHRIIPDINKSYQASFIGTYSNHRWKVLKNLTDKDLHIYGPYWNLLHRGGYLNPPIWGDKVTEIMNRSKIAINIHVSSDIAVGPNMRTFEIPACGALLMSDRPHSIQDYYEIGKEIICYDSVDEMRELIDYFLEMEEERTRIVERGHKRTFSQHTYSHRMKQMLSLIK